MSCWDSPARHHSSMTPLRIHEGLGPIAPLSIQTSSLASRGAIWFPTPWCLASLWSAEGGPETTLHGQLFRAWGRALPDTFTRAPKHAWHPATQRPALGRCRVLTLPRLLSSVLPLWCFHPPPCVSVICTVSSRGVEEINSNSPFPLLIKVMASKNGRQYQLIHQELSISSQATSDLSLPACGWAAAEVTPVSRLH